MIPVLDPMITNFKELGKQMTLGHYVIPELVLVEDQACYTSDLIARDVKMIAL